MRHGAYFWGHLSQACSEGGNCLLIGLSWTSGYFLGWCLGLCDGTRLMISLCLPSHMPLQEFLSMYQACHLESVPWLLWFGRACSLTPQPDRPWQGCVLLLSGSRWTLGWCLGLFGRAGLVDMFLFSYQICHGRSSFSGECSWLPLGSLLLCKATLLALLAGGVVEFLTHTW